MKQEINLQSGFTRLIRHSRESLSGISTLLKSGGDPQTLRAAKHLGRTISNNHTGFTLVELLVVVLIIGILAAVALPQYQKAVEKSKAAQAFALIRTVAAAQEAHHLENGTYAETFEELAVDIPWTGNVQWVKDFPAKSNKDWSIQFYSQMIGNGISIGRISGPYAGAGFVYLLDSSSAIYPPAKILCMERGEGQTDFPFSQPAGSYCKKIFHTNSGYLSPLP